MTGLYRLASRAASEVRVLLQTREYLSEPQAAAEVYPTALQAVLRTQRVWVDRTRLRVAYQVKAAPGSVHGHLHASARRRRCVDTGVCVLLPGEG